MKQRTEIMMPYVISAQPDPFNIHWSGDWAVCLHSWSGLVDYTSEGHITGVLAESWSHSENFLSWTFKLRPILKWSDGSPMTSEQILQSLSASATGTSHSDFSQAIEKIAVGKEDGTIVFSLRRPIPAFLISLSYPDWSIVHPSTLKVTPNKVQTTGFLPCSGSYCVASTVTNSAGTVEAVELKRNTFFTLKPQNTIDSGILRSYVNCESLVDRRKELLTFRSYSEALTPSCLQKLKEEGFVVNRAQPGWVLKADFTRKGLNSVSRPERQKLQAQIQKSLLAKEPGFGVTKSTGIRPLASVGSLSIDEFTKVISDLDSETNNVKLKVKSVKMAVMDVWSKWRAVSWLVSALESQGLSVELDVLTKKAYADGSADGSLQDNYDLLFIPIGSGDPDPDSNWQIARRFSYPSSVSEAELSIAYFETDPAKRNRLYQDLAVQLIREVALIPLMNDADYIGIHESVTASTSPSFRYGLTLYDLVL